MKKTVLISGSGRGIGRAIATRFAKEGYKIAINANKSKDELEETKDYLISLGVPVLVGQGDVGNYEFCKDFVDEVKNTLGSVDILVNNAGISHIGLLSDMMPNEWNEVINTNLTSLYNLSHLVIPDMVRNNAGKIINISSVSGVMGNAGQINYAASKAGVIGMTKTAAREMASRNITVNAIAPGYIRTDMTDAMTDDAKAKINSFIPLGYQGEVEDIANMVAYLAGEEGRYITGQVIKIDGGMSM